MQNLTHKYTCGVQFYHDSRYLGEIMLTLETRKPIQRMSKSYIRRIVRRRVRDRAFAVLPPTARLTIVPLEGEVFRVYVDIPKKFQRLPVWLQ